MTFLSNTDSKKSSKWVTWAVLITVGCHTIFLVCSKVTPDFSKGRAGQEDAPFDLLQGDLLWVGFPTHWQLSVLPRARRPLIPWAAPSRDEHSRGSAGSPQPTWGSSEEQLLLGAFGLAELFSELHCNSRLFLRGPASLVLPPAVLPPAFPPSSRI